MQSDLAFQSISGQIFIGSCLGPVTVTSLWISCYSGDPIILTSDPLSLGLLHGLCASGGQYGVLDWSVCVACALLHLNWVVHFLDSVTFASRSSKPRYLVLNPRPARSTSRHAPLPAYTCMHVDMTELQNGFINRLVHECWTPPSVDHVDRLVLESMFLVTVCVFEIWIPLLFCLILVITY